MKLEFGKKKVIKLEPKFQLKQIVNIEHTWYELVCAKNSAAVGQRACCCCCADDEGLAFCEDGVLESASDN